jgi:hypothetical protein
MTRAPGSRAENRYAEVLVASCRLRTTSRFSRELSPCPSRTASKIEGCDVGVVDGGRAESQQNLGFLDVAGGALDAQAGLFGLGWTWPHRHPSGMGAKALAIFALAAAASKSPDHHQGHVAGHVVVGEEGEMSSRRSLRTVASLPMMGRP